MWVEKGTIISYFLSFYYHLNFALPYAYITFLKAYDFVINIKSTVQADIPWGIYVLSIFYSFSLKYHSEYQKLRTEVSSG